MGRPPPTLPRRGLVFLPLVWVPQGPLLVECSLPMPLHPGLLLLAFPSFSRGPNSSGRSPSAMSQSLFTGTLCPPELQRGAFPPHSQVAGELGWGEHGLAAFPDFVPGTQYSGAILDSSSRPKPPCSPAILPRGRDQPLPAFRPFPPSSSIPRPMGSPSLKPISLALPWASAGALSGKPLTCSSVGRLFIAFNGFFWKQTLSRGVACEAVAVTRTLDINNLREERLVLAHGFGDFSPWSVSSVPLDLR